MTAEKLMLVISYRGLFLSVVDGRVVVSGHEGKGPLAGLSRSLYKAIAAAEPEIVRIIREQEVAASGESTTPEGEEAVAEEEDRQPIRGDNGS